jgi:putative tryptophan/tyrosine transport system substrate-binding protein
MIAALGGVAAWPVVARGQQGERMPRIAFLHDYPLADSEGELQLIAFREALQKLGWTDGRNALIDYQSAAVDSDKLRTYVTEMVARKPDVVLAHEIRTVINQRTAKAPPSLLARADEVIE